ncbi:MAG: extracellular solute-binding protein [Thiotrichales bacterium]|nr:extracellular solute-binding protein [Thiotrichales bacterium]
MRNFLFVALIFLISSSVSAEVNVYSARKEALIKPLFKEFTRATGIRVNLVTGKADALIKRLELEGEHTPADLLLTVDAARLHRARELGLFQELPPGLARDRLPAKYRDDRNTWVGLSVRSRVIVYARDRIRPDQLSSYEDLADPKWRGRICVRSSSNIYNQSLLASLLASLGAEAAENWAAGLVKNFAREPKGGDRDQIKAVAAGQCDLALVNTYYVGGMLNSSIDAEREAVSGVAVFWPNQTGRGAHVNVSGIGLTRASRNREEALQLIEFLLNDDSQRWYAETNAEYPVIAGIPPSVTLRQWGGFRADEMSLIRLGELNAEAVRIMDRVG